jgi:hypothetical protein
VAIKAHIHAPTFFLLSLLFLPFLLNLPDQYFHTRASIPRILPATLVFSKTFALGALLTTASTPATSLKMDAPTIQPKFLKNGSDLGIVAVGFSGGQVNIS